MVSSDAAAAYKPFAASHAAGTADAAGLGREEHATACVNSLVSNLGRTHSVEVSAAVIVLMPRRSCYLMSHVIQPFQGSNLILARHVEESVVGCARWSKATTPPSPPTHNQNTAFFKDDSRPTLAGKDPNIKTYARAGTED